MATTADRRRPRGQRLDGWSVNCIDSFRSRTPEARGEAGASSRRSATAPSSFRRPSLRPAGRAEREAGRSEAGGARAPSTGRRSPASPSPTRLARQTNAVRLQRKTCRRDEPVRPPPWLTTASVRIGSRRQPGTDPAPLARSSTGGPLHLCASRPSFLVKVTTFSARCLRSRTAAGASPASEAWIGRAMAEQRTGGHAGPRRTTLLLLAKRMDQAAGTLRVGRRFVLPTFTRLRDGRRRGAGPWTSRHQHTYTDAIVRAVRLEHGSWYRRAT